MTWRIKFLICEYDNHITGVSYENKIYGKYIAIIYTISIRFCRYCAWKTSWIQINVFFLAKFLLFDDNSSMEFADIWLFKDINKIIHV